MLVSGGVEEVAVFRLVIAEAEEERDAVAGSLEGIAEDDRAIVHAGLIDRDTTAPLRWHAEQAVGEFVGHEDVAHVHVDVGSVEADVLHGSPEELHVRVNVDVWIGGDGEGEGRAARPCGVEAALAASIVKRCADVPMAHAVVILGVRQQTGDRDADGVLELGLGVVDVERGRRGGDGVLAGLCAVFDKDLLVHRGDEIERDAISLWQGEKLRAEDGGIGEQAIDRVGVVAGAGTGGAGARAVRGADREVDRRAAGLRGDRRAPDAVVGGAIAMQAIVKHREREHRRWRGGGDDHVVNADARCACRSRGGIAGGLEADLRLRAQFRACEVVMEELKAVVHRRGKRGGERCGAGVGIRGGAEHKGGGVRDAADRGSTGEVVGSGSGARIRRGGIHQRGGGAGDEREGGVWRDRADACVVRNARGRDEHAFDEARRVRAGGGALTGGDADGHIHRRGEHAATRGKSGGAGAGHGGATCDGTRRVQHHIAECGSLAVPILTQACVPGRAVV